jgi:hypothetical protein
MEKVNEKQGNIERSCAKSGRREIGKRSLNYQPKGRTEINGEATTP